MGVRWRLAPQKHVGGDELDCRKSHVEVIDDMKVLMQTVTLPQE